MNKVLASSALAIAASVSMNAFAQSNDTNQTTQLEPIIVSAGISPVAADQYGRSYTVITRRDIEERGYATVQQALEAQPGISINGDAPNNRQVRIRGGEANHTLILIDGVRVASGDGGFGGYALRGVELGSVERIEIIRGPQSIPYGTDAAAGVVNIITREASEGNNYGGSVTFGEGDAQNAWFSHGSESARLSFSLSNRNDQGFDFSGNGGERDSTRWESGTIKGSFTVLPQTSVGFSYRGADGAYDTDDYDNDASDAEGYVIDAIGASNSVKLLERAASTFVDHSQFGGAIKHRLRFDRASNQTDVPFTRDTYTEVVSYRVTVSGTEGPEITSNRSVNLLIESRTDGEISGSAKRRNDSVALEYTGWLTEVWSLQLGSRYDDNDTFSDAFGWSAASSYILPNTYRIHASAGSAAVSPSFFESANADVTPEDNRGFDVGVEVPLFKGRGMVDITYFRETLVDKIDYPTPTSFTPENVEGKSRRSGIEFQSTFKISRSLDLSASYTYLDAEDPSGEIETRRPRHEIGLRGAWRSADGSASLTVGVRHVRDLYDEQRWLTDSPVAELPSFSVVDLAATHSLTDNIDLTARLTNAFDEDYQEVWGYATRGRAGYVGVRASW